MMSNRRILERYILKAISPYILISLILLTAILFAQQTVRYLEGLFHGLVPSGFVYGVALALLPNVLVFTIPMAVLSGTIIGLGRIGGDAGCGGEYVQNGLAGACARRDRHDRSVVFERAGGAARPA